MNIHEFQAKEILKGYNLPIPEYKVASSVEEVKNILAETSWKKAVVKVQVHAGGRGKAGGVKIGNSPEEILDIADQLIGMKIINNQTGAEGIVAYRVLITPPMDIEKEYYVGATIDRENACPILIASPEGGINIEEVAAKTPEKILKLPIRLNGDLKNFELIRLAKFMGWSGEVAKEGMFIAKQLAKAFLDVDASLLEINPLIKATDNHLYVLDARLSVDDNAIFRQKRINEFYDPSQISKNERAAREHDLAYIALDGNIGCMVNGAGLAMSTMDIIQLYGGKPANFLDVGGSASKEKVAAGFNIILSDPSVKAILVNIFGGIMNCATLAEGIIAAVYENSISVPLIVRLEGTNVEEGKRLLKESKLTITTAQSLSEAAEKAVEALKS